MISSLFQRYGCKDLSLVATDMDGTLTAQGKFTSTLLQSLEELAAVGIKVLIVTGRSAGWVSGLTSYLPVVGAIAENGGVFYPGDRPAPVMLTPIPNIAAHRQQLADTFERLQGEFPHIKTSTDNYFRLTDWTFDAEGLTLTDLGRLQQLCDGLGWGFTYSSVHCHIKPQGQDKATGLLKVLQDYFPDYTSEQIITVGDSANDESLFDPRHFPHSVGVANVRDYLGQLSHPPAYITEAPEANGFCELAQLLGLGREPA